MSLACVQSRALMGLQAPQVTVEVHLANGLPALNLVGLADLEVREARERVRCAIANSGLEYPGNKRITVNLAPADLPKDSGRFDLPIALGILAASGQIDARKLQGWEFAGELSLSGELRPVRGALATALAMGTQEPPLRFVLPTESAREAAWATQIEVYGAQHLLDVVQQLLHHIEQMLCTIDLDLRGPGGFARTLRGQHKAQRWFLRAHGQCRSQRAAHRAQLAGQRQLSGKFPALELACINLAAGGKDAQRNRQVKAAGILG